MTLFKEFPRLTEPFSWIFLVPTKSACSCLTSRAVVAVVVVHVVAVAIVVAGGVVTAREPRNARRDVLFLTVKT